MLIMAKYFRTELDQALTLSRQKNISLTVAEEEIMGVSDAAIGAYLLSLWGLSNPIVEAVALYHQPSRCPSPAIGPLTFVHLGWAMADDERRNVKDEKNSSVDTAYLEALGLRGQLPALRGYCAGAMA
jgi:HD-like signal output (HDOD) protein